MSHELPEYGTLDGLHFSAENVAALVGNGAVDVSPSALTAGTWQMRAKQYVGIIRVADLELRVRPKVAVGHLLFLLSFAADADGWHDVVADFEATDDLVAAMAHPFLHHSERAIASGLLQGYVTREEALPTLRGRFRESEQIRRRMSLPLPIEVSYDDFTVDIAENRMLRSAAEFLLQLEPAPALRYRLLHLLRRLEGVTAFQRGVPVPQLIFTRLNERYRPAVRLSELILESRALAFQRGALAGSGFLFDMNKVFEDFVTAALGRVLSRVRGHSQAQARLFLDVSSAVGMRPDVTWWDGDRCLAVADAKYKATELQQLPNADVYQMLAYCTAYGLNVGHLIYPTGERDPTEYVIRNAGTRIVVHALPLDQRPAALLEAVDRMASRIIAATEPAHLASA